MSGSEHTGNPVALVTGGRTGMGRGIAEALGRAGFDIAVVDLTRDGAAEDTLQALAGIGARTLFLEGDVADVTRHRSLLDEVLDRLGRLDCLVNNAGVSARRRGDVVEVTPESFDRCIAVNVRAPFFLTQCFARLVVDGRIHAAGASVINITSVTAEAIARQLGEYCVSKAAASMASKVFAVRLAELGVPVFEVRPGIVRTDMTSTMTAAYDEAIAGGISLIRRWGEPEDVGATVASLATGAIRFSVGQPIYVDGGMALRVY